ncbi:nascent polypeptide-associated complex subunit alpha, muscle-specific form-like [Poecile atricapillus]|uniref:nascent polypeptide-associated complex subunit alpha, muscle-specific form-like n=1 Tax=Poecile atricapillus TaxID=48891 RepID=UPI002739B56A|nr:nascent polypeptide-associated complex subunit alpha, muscle-specific form-like [Poecile atricapillus]
MAAAASVRGSPGLRRRPRPPPAPPRPRQRDRPRGGRGAGGTGTGEGERGPWDPEGERGTVAARSCPAPPRPLPARHRGDGNLPPCPALAWVRVSAAVPPSHRGHPGTLFCGCRCPWAPQEDSRTPAWRPLCQPGDPCASLEPPCASLEPPCASLETPVPNWEPPVPAWEPPCASLETPVPNWEPPVPAWEPPCASLETPVPAWRPLCQPGNPPVPAWEPPCASLETPVPAWESPCASACVSEHFHLTAVCECLKPVPLPRGAATSSTPSSSFSSSSSSFSCRCSHLKTSHPGIYGAHGRGVEQDGVKVPSHPNHSMTPDSARAHVGQQEGPHNRPPMSTQDAELRSSSPRTELRPRPRAELQSVSKQNGQRGGSRGLSRALRLLSALGHSEVFDHSCNKNRGFLSLGMSLLGELRQGGTSSSVNPIQIRTMQLSNGKSKIHC